jgi:hypothetical protein
VQANVVVPLLQGNQLWGLLVHQLALRLRHSRTSWAVRSALSITASDFA